MLGFTTSPFGHMNGVLELALSTGLESCGALSRFPYIFTVCWIKFADNMSRSSNFSLSHF
ncbi:hypothetical protein N665_0078s0114 [Sinapis alba]|nr:hypothetical protein N665_0078s0114 [Sinapis alba]